MEPVLWIAVLYRGTHKIWLNQELKRLLKLTTNRFPEHYRTNSKQRICAIMCVVLLCVSMYVRACGVLCVPNCVLYLICSWSFYLRGGETWLLVSYCHLPILLCTWRGWKERKGKSGGCQWLQRLFLIGIGHTGNTYTTVDHVPTSEVYEVWAALGDESKSCLSLYSYIVITGWWI